MRPVFAVLVSAPLMLTASCYHATQLAATWHQPGAAPIHFQRAVAAFVTKDEALRRSVEDKLASQFPNTVPSYTIVPKIDTAHTQDAAQQLRDAGFDGAIVMRVVDVTTTTTAYAPGAYWYGRPYGFAGYWGDAWTYPYDPYYYGVDRIVTVETQIYSLPNDQLLFAARSETTNPASAGKLTDSVLRHIKSQLKKDGLMAAAITKAIMALATLV